MSFFDRLARVVQDMLVLHHTVIELQGKTDRLAAQYVELRDEVVFLRSEVQALRGALDLRDQNVLLRIDQLITRRLGRRG